MPQLVFIHGRAQENKDSVALKQDWMDALTKGLRASQLELPITEDDIRFPYYGQTLFDLRQGLAPGDAAEIIIRGDDADQEEEQFLRSVLAEVLGRALDQAIARGDLTQSEIAELTGSDVIERGFLNWGWVKKSLEWIDDHVPGASGTAIALATKDVYDYLRNPGLRDIIENGIRRALVPGEPTVVVAHSLGSVVAYNLLRRDGDAQGWEVPLFVTVGSPLGVKAIRKALAPVGFPGVVQTWFNALDPDDVVALYPLEAPRFSVEPIENHTQVDNPTSNQHGISGYLDDPLVARRIHAALV